MAPVFTMDHLADQPHLAERGFFVEVDHPDAPVGSPTSAAGARLSDRLGPPAPARGAPPACRRGGGRCSATARPACPGDPTPAAGDRRRIDRRSPSTACGCSTSPGCGPGRSPRLQLAHLGADVIKVESPSRLCLGRRLPFHPPGVDAHGPTPRGYFNQWNQGKRRVGLDLADPDGLELARRLVARCDVVVENFAVGVLDRLGLGYDGAAPDAARPDRGLDLRLRADRPVPPATWATARRRRRCPAWPR